jgi:D-beta-D-heptose 7-phosphate kinase/D-beta-D-heptose 1-phosphate adenosyltransferase
MQTLIERLEGLGRPRIALVGDFMLDEYVYGSVERISPESPVPVLAVDRAELHAGGAGNVAAAIAALGAQVACVGVVGEDESGRNLRRLLGEAGADIDGLVSWAKAPTTVKTRFVGLAQHRHPQQMLRVDQDSRADLPADVRRLLAQGVSRAIQGAGVLVVEDYGKGVLDAEQTPQLIAQARSAGCKVIVDPCRLSDYGRYRGATVLKPNRLEAQLASGIKLDGDESLNQAAAKLADITGAEAVVITLDKEGAYLYTGEGGRRVPHHRPRSVYDITGAGDEVLAMLAVALADGVPLDQAAELANVAGGLEVERFGAVPVMRDEVLAELRRLIGLRGSKVLSRGQLKAALDRRRQRGDTVVFTNGCFDLLHMGHVRYLRQARELGHCLVVAINADASVQRLKGPGRPVIGQDERAEMLGSLECVDYVTVFDEDTPVELLGLLKPDLLVKGGATPEIVGQGLVEGYGGKVYRLDLVEGQSTTQIINRIVGANNSVGH